MNLMERLLKLNQVDSQLRALRSRLDSAQRYYDAQCRQHDEVLARREELATQKRTLQAQIGNMETEGASMDEQLEKFRRDMNSAATTKQYTAVLTELETVKNERTKLDDRMLEQMGEVEEHDRLIAEVDEQLEERVKVRDHALAQLEERKQDVGERVAELETERSIAAADVPADVREIFDELADGYDGEAMAEIEEISRRHREYSCGCCHMTIPYNQVTTLMGTVTSLQRCGACTRILYMKDEMRGALAPK